MALNNHESALFSAPVDKIWNLLSPLDFQKLQPSLVASCTTNDPPQVTVGSQRVVTFKDGDKWHLKIKSFCEDTHLITWELFEAEPAITYSSRVDTIQLRRVTTNKQTLLEWSTRFSGDATTGVLEDCKYKKREAFRDLRNTLAGPKKGADASVEGLVRTLISQINNSDWLEHNPPTGEVIFVPEATAKAPGPTTFSMSMLTPQQRQLMERIEANHLSSMKKS